MSAAGFTAWPADTPERVASLHNLPANKVVQHTRGGTIGYVYADPLVCGCLYVGDQAAFGRHRQELFQRQLANEREMTAQMNMDGRDDAPWGNTTETARRDEALQPGEPSMMFRHGSLWSGSALCACAGRADELSASDPLPANYTSPAKAPESGRAPRMQARMVGGLKGGPRTWALVFGKDDDVMSGLSDWVAREGIQGGHLQAIGSLSSSLFGWFDKERRAYLNVPVDEQAECISLNGDIGLVKSKPALHVHGCVVGRDGVVKGGHLLHTVVWPTLEVFATEAEVPMHKQADAETTLGLFQLGI